MAIMSLKLVSNHLILFWKLECTVMHNMVLRSSIHILLDSYGETLDTCLSHPEDALSLLEA